MTEGVSVACDGLVSEATMEPGLRLEMGIAGGSWHTMY
jgi:hypothetical protein